ncbi:MAG TPA: hypothetical protein VEB22_12240 [Phycisphaerales bacterium]|nr:hypothetical protein [Phycisphaerales bacterium]
MLTTVAASLLSITTAAPVAPAAIASGVQRQEPVPSSVTTTLAAALPTPGAWALMGLGGLALMRARREKR